MDTIVGSAPIVLFGLLCLLLLAIYIDVRVMRKRSIQQQVAMQQKIAELETKVASFERSIHALGQRLLMDEKVIRDLKQVPKIVVSEKPVEPLVKGSDDYPGQIASWVEQSSERPDSMTEAESLLQAMLRERNAVNKL